VEGVNTPKAYKEGNLNKTVGQGGKEKKTVAGKNFVKQGTNKGMLKGDPQKETEKITRPKLGRHRRFRK